MFPEENHPAHLWREWSIVWNVQDHLGHLRSIFISSAADRHIFSGESLHSSSLLLASVQYKWLNTDLILCQDYLCLCNFHLGTRLTKLQLPTQIFLPAPPKGINAAINWGVYGQWYNWEHRGLQLSTPAGLNHQGNSNTLYKSLFGLIPNDSVDHPEGSSKVYLTYLSMTTGEVKSKQYWPCRSLEGCRKNLFYTKPEAEVKKKPQCQTSVKCL